MVVWLLNKKMKPCDFFFLFFFFFIRVTQTCWVFFFFSHCRFSKMTPLPGESGLFQKALLNTCTFSKCSTGNKGRIQTEMRVRNNLRTSGTPGGWARSRKRAQKKVRRLYYVMLAACIFGSVHFLWQVCKYCFFFFFFYDPNILALRACTMDCFGFLS